MAAFKWVKIEADFTLMKGTRHETTVREYEWVTDPFLFRLASVQNPTGTRIIGWEVYLYDGTSAAWSTLGLYTYPIGTMGTDCMSILAAKAWVAENWEDGWGGVNSDLSVDDLIAKQDIWRRATPVPKKEKPKPVEKHRVVFVSDEWDRIGLQCKSCKWGIRIAPGTTPEEAVAVARDHRRDVK